MAAPRQSSQRIALIGMNMPRYESMALRMLHASLSTDARLDDVSVARIEYSTDADPWWIVYDLINLNPLPTALCFSVYCWNANKLYDCMRLIAQVHPDIPMFVGGPEVGPIADMVLDGHPYIDAVIYGEGEIVIRDIVLSLARGGDLDTVPGVITRAMGERFKSAEIRPAVVENLDKLASPYTALYPPPTDGSAYVETYRGCPHSCAYCYEGKGQKLIRSYSWERIERDIAFVAETPGMQSFSFIDSVFNLTQDRLRKLSDILAPYALRGIALHTIEVDIEAIDDGQATLLARAGVKSVETGPQTTCPMALERVNRRFNAEKFRAGVAACKGAGIRVECDVIIGLPGDTVESVLETMRFVVESRPAVLQVSTLHVLPGTELYDSAENLGLKFDIQAPHEVIQTSDISYHDLRNLEVFGTALASLYRAQL